MTNAMSGKGKQREGEFIRTTTQTTIPLTNIVSGKVDVQINNLNNINQQHSADQRRPRQGRSIADIRLKPSRERRGATCRVNVKLTTTETTIPLTNIVSGKGDVQINQTNQINQTL